MSSFVYHLNSQLLYGDFANLLLVLYWLHCLNLRGRSSLHVVALHACSVSIILELQLAQLFTLWVIQDAVCWRRLLSIVVRLAWDGFQVLCKLRLVWLNSTEHHSSESIRSLASILWLLSLALFDSVRMEVGWLSTEPPCHLFPHFYFPQGQAIVLARLILLYFVAKSFLLSWLLPTRFHDLIIF